MKLQLKLAQNFIILIYLKITLQVFKVFFKFSFDAQIILFLKNQMSVISSVLHAS